MPTRSPSPFRLLLLAGLAAGLATAGCDGDTPSGDDAGPGEQDGGAGEQDGGPGEQDGGPGDVDGGPTAQTDAGPTGGTDAGSGLANGSTCTEDDECRTGHCYLVPFLGGQCGDCTEDVHCEGGGCSPHNPFASSGSVCNMGELGGGCQTTDACAEGLTCGAALHILGLLEFNTCGECATDSDCSGGELCAPVTNISEYSGRRECIAPRSLALDSFCEQDGNGGEACESGVCSVVDAMGVLEVGACGECNSDSDCPGSGSATCIPGKFEDGDASALFGDGLLLGSYCR